LIVCFFTFSLEQRGALCVAVKAVVHTCRGFFLFFAFVRRNEGAALALGLGHNEDVVEQIQSALERPSSIALDLLKVSDFD
jgi:hypothetical protein